MRGWQRWVGGALAVLVGVTLTVALVGAPRSTAPAAPGIRGLPTPEGDDGRHDEVEQGSEQRGMVPAIARRIERDLHRDAGDDVADEIARQRSAMRAAIALLVAGGDAGARVR